MDGRMKKVAFGVLIAYFTIAVACSHVNTYRVSASAVVLPNSLPPDAAPTILALGHDVDPTTASAAQADAAQSDDFEPFEDPPQIAFSGGGYRATLFSLGAAWRLYELGLLCRTKDISSVSGGSIFAAYMAVHWTKICGSNHLPDAFKTEISENIIALTHHTIDLPAIVLGAMIPGDSASAEVSSRLDRRLYHGARLRQLATPAGPRFHLFATDLGNGLPWEFRGDRMGIFLPTEGLSLYIDTGEVSVADAVAASAAFPPFLAPARFQFLGAEESLEKNIVATRNSNVGIAQAEVAAGSNLILVTPEQAAQSVNEAADISRRFAQNFKKLELADGGLANNLGTRLCGGLRSNCVIADAAVTPKRETVWPTWIGVLVTATNIIYARKEDEIRENIPGPGGTDPLGGVLIGLRNRGDVQGTNRDAAGVYKDIVRSVPRIIQLARQGDDFLNAWASGAERWRGKAYEDEQVKNLITNYQQYACNSMVSTRLRALDSASIGDLIDLGYLATELNLEDALARGLDVEGSGSTAVVEAQSKLSMVLHKWLPNLFRAELHLPVKLGPIPTTKCKPMYAYS
jgi:hypothetical protein